MARGRPSQPSMDRKFEIQSAADTLMRAEEVRQNKSLMKAARGELSKRAVAINKAKKMK